MPAAKPALNALKDELRDLKGRMALTDPRKQRVNNLLLAIGDKLSASATAAQIAAITAAAAAIKALFGVGTFDGAMLTAEASVAAL